MSDATRIVKIVSRVFGALALISACTLLAFGGSCYNRAVNFKKTAVEAQGTVVELKEGAGGGTDSHPIYYPIIRFADKARQDHTLYSSSGSYPPAYEVGERVSVLYDPMNPKEAKVNSFSDLWLWPLLLGIMGALDLFTGLILFFGVPLIIAWAERRAAKASSP